MSLGPRDVAVEGRVSDDDGLETPPNGSFSVSYRPEPYKESSGLFHDKRTDEGLWSELTTGQKASYVFHNGFLKFLPCKPLKTLTDAYKGNSIWSTLKMDLIAGSTVGIMIIPQSMAYAMIAGLPGEYVRFPLSLSPPLPSLSLIIGE